MMLLGFYVSLYGLLLVLVLLMLRPRLIVYNISAEQLRSILAETVARLDTAARWAGDSLSMPNLGVQLHLDAQAAMRNVALVSVRSAARLRRLAAAGAGLGAALAQVPVKRNRLGLPLLLSAAAMLAALAVHHRPQPAGHRPLALRHAANVGETNSESSRSGPGRIAGTSARRPSSGRAPPRGGRRRRPPIRRSRPCGPGCRRGAGWSGAPVPAWDNGVRRSSGRGRPRRCPAPSPARRNRRTVRRPGSGPGKWSWGDVRIERPGVEVDRVAADGTHDGHAPVDQFLARGIRPGRRGRGCGRPGPIRRCRGPWPPCRGRPCRRRCAGPRRPPTRLAASS